MRHLGSAGRPGNPGAGAGAGTGPGGGVGVVVVVPGPNGRRQNERRDQRGGVVVVGAVVGGVVGGVVVTVVVGVSSVGCFTRVRGTQV